MCTGYTTGTLIQKRTAKTKQRTFTARSYPHLYPSSIPPSSFVFSLHLFRFMDIDLDMETPLIHCDYYNYNYNHTIPNAAAQPHPHACVCCVCTNHY